MKFILLATLIALIVTFGIWRSYFLTFRPFQSDSSNLNLITRCFSIFKAIIFFLIILPFSYLELFLEAYLYSVQQSQKQVIRQSKQHFLH